MPRSPFSLWQKSLLIWFKGHNTMTSGSESWLPWPLYEQINIHLNSLQRLPSLFAFNVVQNVCLFFVILQVDLNYVEPIKQIRGYSLNGTKVLSSNTSHELWFSSQSNNDQDLLIVRSIGFNHLVPKCRDEQQTINLASTLIKLDLWDLQWTSATYKGPNGIISRPHLNSYLDFDYWVAGPCSSQSLAYRALLLFVVSILIP